MSHNKVIWSKALQAFRDITRTQLSRTQLSAQILQRPSTCLHRLSPHTQARFFITNTNARNLSGFLKWRIPKLRNGKRLNSTKPPMPTPGAPTPSTETKALSLSERMKKLSREYGYSAVGVYLFLSLLDFPFCFLAVRYIGTEKIAQYEHVVIDWFWKIVPDWINDYHPAPIGEGEPGYEGAVEEVRGMEKKKEVSIWTELALAYAVHKSLIFFRVPLTAAVTPKIVKTLRSWGFNIGKKGGLREGVTTARQKFPRKKQDVPLKM